MLVNNQRIETIDHKQLLQQLEMAVFSYAITEINNFTFDIWDE